MVLRREILLHHAFCDLHLMERKTDRQSDVSGSDGHISPNLPKKKRK